MVATEQAGWMNPLQRLALHAAVKNRLTKVTLSPGLTCKLEYFRDETEADSQDRDKVRMQIIPRPGQNPFVPYGIYRVAKVSQEGFVDG